MNIIKTWVPLIVINAALLLGFYLWQVNGWTPAGNVVQFVGWFVGGFGLVGAVIPAEKPIIPRSPIRNATGWAFTIVITLLFAGAGHFALAALYCLGAFGSQMYRDRFDKDGHPFPDPLG